MWGFRPGGFWSGDYVREVLSRGLCPDTVNCNIPSE